MEKMGIKCLFYETTGKTTCPFHIIKYDTLVDLAGCVHHVGVAFKRPKAKRKTARRVYGKSR